MYKDLFTSTAEYYAKYRDAYPATFIEYLKTYYNLDGTGSCVDLGCGTGELAIPLAHHFEEVVGVDPEAEMLVQAEARATKVGLHNIRWVFGRAESVLPALGMFRLTTIGTALHWMDSDKVVHEVYNHTEPGGGLVVATVGPKMPWSHGTEVPPWKMRLMEILQQYLGPERRAGSGLYVHSKRKFEDVFNDSPFHTYTTYTYNWVAVRNIDAIIGYSFSTSWGSRALFRDRAESFATDVRQELLRIVPSGQFKETVFLQLFLMRRG